MITLKEPVYVYCPVCRKDDVPASIIVDADNPKGAKMFVLLTLECPDCSTEIGEYSGYLE